MAFGFPAKYSETVEYPGVSRDVARDAAVYAFRVLGWEYVESSAGDYFVETKMSLDSFGEKISVFFPHSGRIHIQSKCNFTQIFDWGKNKRNVKEFLAHFEGRLTRELLDPKPEPENFDVEGRTPLGRVLSETE